MSARCQGRLFSRWSAVSRRQSLPTPHSAGHRPGQPGGPRDYEQNRRRSERRATDVPAQVSKHGAGHEQRDAGRGSHAEPRHGRADEQTERGKRFENPDRGPQPSRHAQAIAQLQEPAEPVAFRAAEPAMARSPPASTATSPSRRSPSRSASRRCTSRGCSAGPWPSSAASSTPEPVTPPCRTCCSTVSGSASATAYVTDRLPDRCSDRLPVQVDASLPDQMRGALPSAPAAATPWS
jgi:hypothetical protein